MTVNLKLSGEFHLVSVQENERANVPLNQLLHDVSSAALAETATARDDRFVNQQTGNLRMSSHSLILRTPRGTVLVDTCVGNDKERDVPAWNQLQIPFLDRFAEAGFDPHTVDAVVCTHLHTDHVGWNTVFVDGEWRPTFPERRYLFAGPEYAHWSAEPFSRRVEHGDSIEPVVRAGLVDLVDTDAEIAPGVRLVSTPGHTPGHCSIGLSSNGEEALITGDFIHHPVQIAAPEWCSRFDTDAAMGERTRRDFIDDAADGDLLVIGTHFGGPGSGRIVSTDDGHILEPSA